MVKDHGRLAFQLRLQGQDVGMFFLDAWKFWAALRRRLSLSWRFWRRRMSTTRLLFCISKTIEEIHDGAAEISAAASNLKRLARRFISPR